MNKIKNFWELIKTKVKNNPKKSLALGVLVLIIIVVPIAFIVVTSSKPLVADLQVPNLVKSEDETPVNISDSLVSSDYRLGDLAKSGTITPVASGAPVDYVFNLQFKAGTSTSQIDEYLKSIDAQVVKKNDTLLFYTVRSATYKGINELPKSDILGVSSQDTTVALTAFEFNDQFVGQQWAVGPMKIKEAHEKVLSLGQPAKQTIVGVIDTGACLNHPDLKNIYLPGFNAINYTESGYEDVDGHGCAVSGVIAAVANNKEGIVGIAPNVKIVPVKAMTSKGGYSSDISFGILWAQEHGATIINLSLGSYVADEYMANAISYVQSRGVVVVAAAGNDGSKDLFYPASFNGVVSVGALDSSFVRTWFSNYGPTIDAWAPGDLILSTDYLGKYKKVSGTSLASPYVAGLIALNAAFCRTDTSFERPVASFNTTAAFDVESCYPGTKPVFNKNPETLVDESTTYTAGIGATSKNILVPIKYSVKSGPSGLTIDANSGVITWPNTVLGQHEVKIIADNGLQSEYGFSINVRAKVVVVVPPPAAPGGITKTYSQNGKTINLYGVVKAPSAFQSAAAEYAAWADANPGFSCASTAIDVQKPGVPNSVFEVWECSRTIGGGKTLALQKDASYNLVPVKYTTGALGGTLPKGVGQIYYNGVTQAVLDAVVALGYL